MTYAPNGTKGELRASKRQLATVIDLNKCMGCQTCVVACKNLWTVREGTDHMRWMNVTTYPGKGYPRDYEHKGGGFRDGVPQTGALTTMADCGDSFRFNHDAVLYEGKGSSVWMHPVGSDGKPPEWGYNWDEDSGGGEFPNAFRFYLPRMCNHCTHPACIDACPNNALYKRDEDGIVLLDQERCRGHRHCIEACPYKAIYFNPVTEKSEKCILCFPRVEKHVAPACNRQCPGRTRAFGFLDDEDGQVHQLVRKWRVALPLHPEYGTEPNVYYVPPWSPFAYAGDGSLTEQMRIPLALLEELFGPDVHRALKVLADEREKKRRREDSELMDILISRTWEDRYAEFTAAPLEPHVAGTGGKPK
ncbi:MAG: respiratory nitrate reductase subunit beta [Gammaproteobacteria bacterium]|nr:respiratory nitrate reductase subunit beta [Gammaproteobacteria bacterium]